MPEDASVGVMYVGANLTAILATFVGQVLLGLEKGDVPAPFFPYGYWIICSMLICVVPILLFNGQYLRLEQDK